jgi:hypothetical protein
VGEQKPSFLAKRQESALPAGLEPEAILTVRSEHDFGGQRCVV